MNKKILLITFDLTRPSEEYKGLWELLRNQGSWSHYMRYTWLIYTDKSAEEMSDAIVPAMKGRGRMLIAELRRPYQGLLPKDAWEWIRERIDEPKAKPPTSK